MKQTFMYSALLATALFLNACQSKQQASEATTPADTTEILPNRADSQSDVAVSDWLEKLVGSEDGLFRGVNLGDAVSVVKENENGEPFEEDAAHIGYTIDYPNLESTDIQYFLDKNKKVIRIDVDIYLNNRASVDTHLQELTAYFTRKYGNAVEKSWNAAGHRITLADVSKGKDFGLKLTFGGRSNA
ncbi:hypothetical protein GCM10028803_01440 [Larkinella knui]|uniref:Lipoprotein n=1 Tax=Larkinella knui TaxID=2025310 RepID=A0A3P1CLE2_9BACT|nr:hypothetical protein [Larkinella knui]RRB14151.1 hypothetical protein EHT87_18095 [Larkinella knui]